MAREATKPSFERDVAPHVDPHWAEDFILELRVSGVPGAEIGAALAEVESHCAESGTGAEESFGPATEYARGLGLEPDPAQSTRHIVAAVAPTAVQLLGMMAVTWAVPSLARGEMFPVTIGALLSGAALMVALVAITWQTEAVLRLVAFRPWVAWAGGMVIIAATVVPVATLHQPVGHMPTGAAIIGGAAVLLVGVVWEIAQIRRDPQKRGQDVLAAPLEQPAAVTRRARQGRWLTVARVALIPVWTIVLSAIVLLLP